MSDPRVLRHVIDSITPASAAHGEGARQNVAAANLPLLERLAIALGAAQHTARPRGAHKRLLVCAGDHGVGDPGIALGAADPTVVAAVAIADGSAAVAQVARSSTTPIVLVDAGVREPAAMPADAIALGRGPSQDLTREPALSVVDAALALEAGIALVTSLHDAPLDVLALGAIGIGADVAAEALLAAATRTLPVLDDAVAVAAAARGIELANAGALELLAAFGGPETGVLAGAILAAASTNVPVILDSYATGAAALIAARFAPAVTGYLIAAHTGQLAHPRILAHLDLVPLFDVGLGHGEGAGAAMALALVDQVAAVARRE